MFQTKLANSKRMNYIERFRTETALIERYTGSKAFVVWSMGLYLDIQDLEQLASDNLTDKSDDHGIDPLSLDCAKRTN